jgi:3-mercaptopropionate dioxygenase
MSAALQPLIEFARTVQDTLRHRPTEQALLPPVQAALQRLIAQDTWLPDALAEPGRDSYRQYLLHRPADARYSIVSFVWGPDQGTPIHDHGVWGLIGMLRGSELGTRFVRGEPGSPMRALGERRLATGDIEAVSPRLGDVHQVRNGTPGGVSISIHVYGADIGAVRRHVYDAATSDVQPFVSGYSPNALTDPVSRAIDAAL